MSRCPLVIVGDHDDATKAQMANCLSYGSAVHGVLCADGHLGYAQPVGGVIAYTDHISVSGVGFDIACGNLAVRTDIKQAELLADTSVILADIAKRISFGVGRTNPEPVDHDLFDSDLWNTADVSDLKQMARSQLGTVGSGNHYVDLFYDRDDFVWIGVHFGSRGLGHKIATKYIALAGGKDGIDVAPALLEAKSDLGQQYLAGMALAGEYAYAGRDWVVAEVLKIIGAQAVDYIHNHHNFAWQEIHGNKAVWVVRKGATPAWPNQRGFVGGSMGDNAVIIKGCHSGKSLDLLYSTVHGAGRVLSRTQARGKKNKIGEWVREPKVSHAEMYKWLNHANVNLRGGDVDEAPQAYRRLSEVLGHHKGTIEVQHVLMPFAVLMAGSNEYDPYKD